MAESVFNRGMCNPVIRKMRTKTNELSGASPRLATYRGILNKSAYFILLSIVGIISYFVLHPVIMNHFGATEIIKNVNNAAFTFNFHLYEGLAFIATAFISFVFPLLAWLLRPLIPVIGTIYALAQGYMIGFLVGNLNTKFQWIGLAAFAITVILVCVMLILYTSGWLKVNQKMRAFIAGFFFTGLIVSALSFVLYFIPFTRPYIQMINTGLNNPYIDIGISVIYLLVATLFLLVDFDVIQSCVEDRMPKRMEWMAAWGVSYTIIYLYLKIFNVLLKIFSRKEQ